MLAGLLLVACSIDVSTGTPATTPASAVPPPGSTAPAVTQLPITWADLHLKGRLIYTAAVLLNNESHNDVQSLDLVTGKATTLFFQTANKGWVDSAAMSPDGQQLVISYVPATGTAESLYILPAGGSQPPKLLFTPEDMMDQYAQVVWSPDGKYLYFAYVKYKTGGPPAIWRVAYPGGNPERVVDNAYWPRLSPDSTRLAYVSPDPKNGNNRLYVAAADGTQAQEIPVQGPYMSNTIDVPMFAPDGRSILFSSPDPPQSSMFRGLDAVLAGGFTHALDGTIPSDWWSIPMTGGVPKQLTHIAALSLYGSYAPDNQHIASSSTSGIFVMNPDGTAVTVVVPDIGNVPGTVNWMP